jgi:thymidine phosphorylase
VRADADGYVTAVDAYGMGIAAWRLGAGRARKEDRVAASAGVLLRKRPGDAVRAGEVLYELHTEEAARIPAARDIAAGAVRIGANPPPVEPLILDRIAVR